MSDMKDKAKEKIDDAADGAKKAADKVIDKSKDVSHCPYREFDLFEMMGLTRLSATRFRCLSCQLFSRFSGLVSAPASPWNWRTSHSVISSMS